MYGKELPKKERNKMINLINILNNYWSLILIAVLSLIEITPVKFSPIEWLGTKLNKTTNKKIDTLSEKVENYHQEEAKILISDFVQDIKNGEEKSKTQWISIMNLATEYVNKGWNSEVKQDAIFIEKEYQKKYMKGSE